MCMARCLCSCPATAAGKYVFLRKTMVRMKEMLNVVSFMFWIELAAFLALAVFSLATDELHTCVSPGCPVLT